MNHQYQLYELSSGHVIVTPAGKPITEEEFLEYFSIVSDWLKAEKPEKYEAISPSLTNDSHGSMVSKIVEALVFDAVWGGTERYDRYFFDTRSLAFLYVTSYYIQKENRERLNPFLNHAMGRALLEWLPLPELVEHYLAASALGGGHCGDAILLSEIFGDGPRYRRWGFERNPDKALKYAKIACKGMFYEYWETKADFAYAKALFRKDEANTQEAMALIRKGIDALTDGLTELAESDEYPLRDYLELGFEICSKVKLQDGDFDVLSSAYDVLGHDWIKTLANAGCDYWLAQCLINGINNPKDIDEAIRLLSSVRNPNYVKRAGLALAKLYSEGNGVEKDPAEAAAIASLTLLQRGVHPAFGAVDPEDEALKAIGSMQSWHGESVD